MILVVGPLPYWLRVSRDSVLDLIPGFAWEIALEYHCTIICCLPGVDLEITHSGLGRGPDWIHEGWGFWSLTSLLVSIDPPQADACHTEISWHKLSYGAWRRREREVTPFSLLRSCSTVISPFTQQIFVKHLLGASMVQDPGDNSCEPKSQLLHWWERQLTKS